MRWPRLFTALITPYQDSGEVSTVTAAALARHLTGQGSGGFILAGSTGEAFGLALDEREKLFRAVRDALPPEIPVWLGTGSNDTRTTIAWTEAADAWGADGVLVVAPYYNKPTPWGLERHFEEAARHTQKPLMIYNVPGRTGVVVTPDTVSRVVRSCDNVLAVKEAQGQVKSVVEMVRGVPEHVKVYSGDDALLLPSLSVGAYGVVSVAAHVAAEEMSSMIDDFLAGSSHAAMRRHYRLWPVAEKLFVASNPIPLKWLLRRLGWDVGGVRLPLAMPGDDDLGLESLWEAFSHLRGEMEKNATP